MPKKKLLLRSNVYAIAQDAADAARILKGSCGIIQLRDKDAPPAALIRAAKAFVRSAGDSVVTIMNDHPDIARISGCDGVHVGQQDCPVWLCRRILGEGKIVGVSCHTAAQALEAQAQGADYIGIGPLFETRTKQDAVPIAQGWIAPLLKQLRIPAFAIGGITHRTITALMRLGFTRIAVSSALINASHPAAAARRFSAALRGSQ